MFAAIKFGLGFLGWLIRGWCGCSSAMWLWSYRFHSWFDGDLGAPGKLVALVILILQLITLRAADAV